MVPAVDVKHPDVGSWRSLTVGLHLPAEDGHTGVGRRNWKKVQVYRENRGHVKCMSAFITLKSITQSALWLFIDSISERCSLTLRRVEWSQAGQPHLRSCCHPCLDGVWTSQWSDSSAGECWWPEPWAERLSHLNPDWNVPHNTRDPAWQRINNYSYMCCLGLNTGATS